MRGSSYRKVSGTLPEYRGKYRSRLLCCGVLIWTLATIKVTSATTTIQSSSPPPCNPPTLQPSDPPALRDSFRFLQIGANDFQTGASDDFQEWLRREAGNMYRLEAVLVEPNPVVFKHLQDNTHYIFGDAPSTNLRLLRSAVCPSSTGKITFWIVSDQFVLDFPQAPHWQKYQLSSINKDIILMHGISPQYVVPIEVDCYSPLDILAAANFTPGSLDVLAVDAEGFDVAIVSAFLDLPLFAPALLKFECNRFKGGCEGDEALQVRQRLDSKGYMTYTTEDIGVFGNLGGDVWALSNTFAWYKRLIQAGTVQEPTYSDQDYVATFHATGCPNSDSSLIGNLQYWRKQRDLGLSDMYAFCVLVKTGKADAVQVRTCCGSLSCRLDTCTLMSAMRRAGAHTTHPASSSCTNHLDNRGSCWLDTSKLLTPQRFDTALKLIYVEDWVRGAGTASRVARELYTSHMVCWSGRKGTRNGFNRLDAEWPPAPAWPSAQQVTSGEFPHLGKGTRCTCHSSDGNVFEISVYHNFTCNFECLLTSLVQRGFIADGALQVFSLPDRSQWLFKVGSHRFAGAVALDLPFIPVEFGEKWNNPGVNLYDSAYFQGHTVLRNKPKCALPDWHIDFAFYALLPHRPHMLLLTIWPRSAHLVSDATIKRLSDRFSVSVWFHKKIWLTSAALETYMLHAYGDVSWAPSKANKVKSAGSGPQTLSLYWLEGESLAPVRQIRDALRRLLDTKHSTHLTDTRQEMLLLSRLALFRESLQWINGARNSQNCLTIAKQMAKYHRLEDSEVPGVWLHPDAVAVDSSAVLYIHGIRTTNILSIVYDWKRFPKYKALFASGANSEAHGWMPLGDHTDGSAPHGMEFEDLLHHPLHFGFCFGLKFISLAQVRVMKTNRAGAKDLRDVSLIGDFLAGLKGCRSSSQQGHGSCTDAMRVAHAFRMHEWNRTQGITPPWHPSEVRT